MNKFKKGISLLAVIAFLITALVPLGAMAAPPLDPQPDGTAQTAPAPTAAAGVRGTFSGAADQIGSGYLYTPQTGVDQATLPAGTQVQDVYVWKGSRVSVSMPNNAAAQAWAWNTGAQVSVSNSTTDAAVALTPVAAPATVSGSTVILDTSAAGLGASPSGAFSNTSPAGDLYLVGFSGTALCTVVYRLIPVQATVEVVSADNTSYTAAWGDTAQNVSAQWTVVRYDDGSVVQGLPATAPPDSTLQCFVYEMDTNAPNTPAAPGASTTAPINLRTNVTADAQNGWPTSAASLTRSIETTNGTLPVKILDNNNNQVTYQYEFYGSSTAQTAAAGPALAGSGNRSAGPVTNMASTHPAWTPWSALEPVANVAASSSLANAVYSRDTWNQAQVRPKTVRAVFEKDGTLAPQGTAAQQQSWTLPAKMGAVTVLRAELPYNSYGVWTINYNDDPVNPTQSWYSAQNTQNVTMTDSTNRVGAVKVIDDPKGAAGNSPMGVSTLQFVVPKSTETSTSSQITEPNITVTYHARTFCDWQDANNQLYMPDGGWPTVAANPNAALNSWPWTGQSFGVSTTVQFGLIPSLEQPDAGSVIVTPTTNVLAKDENAQFDIELASPGGLLIDSITATATMKDSLLNSAEAVTRVYQVAATRVGDTGNTWQLDTKNLPVGNYTMDFKVYVVNPQLQPTATNYRYELNTSASIQIMEFQGRVLNSNESNWASWSTQTGLLSVAPNQVLQLDAKWLDKVYPMAGWPNVDKNGNPTALGYAWSLTDSNGNVANASSLLVQHNDETTATLTIPSTGIPAGQVWTVSCQPKSVPRTDSTFAQVSKNVGLPVTFTLQNAQSSSLPKISGYYYEVSPASDVFPADSTMAKYQVNAANANNIPVTEPAGTSAFAVAGSTVRISPVLSLQNNPDDFTYQWMVLSGAGWTKLVEGQEVSGVTSRVLTLSASVNTKGLQLYCAVTNKVNSALQAPALTNGTPNQFVDLQVRTPGAVDAQARPLPLITSNPSTGQNPVQNPSNVTTVTVSTGMKVTFSVEDKNVTDGAPAPLPNEYCSFQWMSSRSQNGPFTAIEGATGPTYTVTATQENNDTYYQCHVVNEVSEGQKTGDSNKIRLSVHAPNGSVWFTEPETALDPQNVRPGAVVTLSAKAESDNGDAVNYQWQVATVSKNTSIEEVIPGAWTNVTGATSETLTTSPLTLGYYFYRCVATNATNAGKSAVSVPFRVNVMALSNMPNVTPSHFSNEAAQTVRFIPAGAAEGNSVTFQASGTIPNGDGVLYTWKMIGPKVTGTGAAQTLTFQDPTSEANTTILAAGTDGTLTIDVPMAYNGCSFVCQVSNATDPTAYRYSAVWNLTVWPKDTVPTLIEEPKDITATYPNPYSDSTQTYEDRKTEIVASLPMPGDTTTGAAAPGIGSVVLQKLSGGAWTNITPATNSVVQLLQQTGTQIRNGNPTKNPDNTQVTYTAEAILGMDAYLENGTYRFALQGYAPTDVEWTAPQGGGYPIPTAFSDPFEVKITVIGQPVITQQPAALNVQVGQQATFTVVATVEPATTQLTYRWQKSLDGGETWENCIDSDGTGFGTPTFTTIPATVEMQNAQPIYYRCVVQNLATQQSATSTAAGLGVLDATGAAGESIAVAEGTTLSISEKDGVKYLSGTALEATKNGTTVSQLKAMMAAPAEGYSLQVTAADGTAKADDAIVGTGDLLKLVSGSGQTADQVTIVVRGDVLGSGVMSLTQLVRMAEAFRPADSKPLEGAFFMAGDLTGTGSIDLTDLVQEAGMYRTELMAA